MNYMKQAFILFSLLLVVLYIPAQQSPGDPTLTEIWRPVPAIVTPGKTSMNAPSDAIILFAGKKDTVNWFSKDDKPFNWKVDDTCLTVIPFAGDLYTKKSFGDCQLHIEWRTPAIIKGDGQGRGNSGIFLMSRYELQVLDSYNNPTYSNGQAGSIYKQHMPLVNVCRPPGEWQVYDIVFTAPQFYPDSSLRSPARITVFQNGILIQHNIELWGSMQFIGVPKYTKHASREPLLLQDHHNPVSYRNIWIREL
jgi:Domain of Unknown Function (DUF1080)